MSNLLYQANFQYLGAFRVPFGTFGATSFGYSGGALAYNAANNSLFISKGLGYVAEISIPTPVNSGNLNDLNIATVLQNFADITEGKMSQIVADNGVGLAGLLVYDNQIIWTALSYYDASYTADRSHGTSTLDLSDTDDAAGLYRVGSMNPGYVAGYMAVIPTAWQSSLGKPLLTGQSNVPIISRTSTGPTAIGFDPADFSPMPAVTPVTSFTYDANTTEQLETQNSFFNFNSGIGGMVFPGGNARSIVYFGHHGLGEVCYGTPEHCSDPDRGGSGWHDVGGNYAYQAWAYDADDFLAVKNSEKTPQELLPYSIWNIQFPLAVADAKIGGVAYDPNTNRAFIVQSQGQPGSLEDLDPRPLIHVYQITDSPEISKGETFENDWLKLVFNATPIANIADNASASPLTNLYVSLHTAYPGESGDQSTSEISYTGYVRKAVARTSGGWTVTGDSVSPAAAITFGKMTGGAGGTVTHVAIGTAASGTGKILYFGSVIPTIVVSNGVTPQLTISTVITED